jgi:hypothetical protein
MESFFATAPRGLEEMLLSEVRSQHASDARAVPGGVAFSGTWDVCYRVNFWSRIASRQRYGAEEPAEEPGVRHASHQGCGLRPLARRNWPAPER